MDGFEKRAEHIKANPALYRELERLYCECSRGRSTIAIFYVGEDAQRWIWTPSNRGAGNDPDQDPDGLLVAVRHPPRAVPLPDKVGDVAHPALALCPRCHTGVLLMPQVGRIEAIPLGAPTWARVTD